MTEAKDLKNKSVEELRALGRELRESIRDFRFGGAGSRKRDVKGAKTFKRDVARIETELSARLRASRGQARAIAEQAK